MAARSMSKEEQLKQCSKILQFLLSHKDAGKVAMKLHVRIELSPPPCATRPLHSAIFGTRNVEGMGAARLP